MGHGMNCILITWIFVNLVVVTLGKHLFIGKKGKQHCKLNPTMPRIIGGYEAKPRKKIHTRNLIFPQFGYPRIRNAQIFDRLSLYPLSVPTFFFAFSLPSENWL